MSTETTGTTDTGTTDGTTELPRAKSGRGSKGFLSRMDSLARKSAVKATTKVGYTDPDTGDKASVTIGTFVTDTRKEGFARDALEHGATYSHPEYVKMSDGTLEEVKRTAKLEGEAAATVVKAFV